MLMQAQGRGTTRHTGQNFPTNSTYQNGQWNVMFELPDLPSGHDCGLRRLEREPEGPRRPQVFLGLASTRIETEVQEQESRC